MLPASGLDISVPSAPKSLSKRKKKEDSIQQQSTFGYNPEMSAHETDRNDSRCDEGKFLLACVLKDGTAKKMTDESAVTYDTHGATYTMHTATGQMHDTSHHMHADISDMPRQLHGPVHTFTQDAQHSYLPTHTGLQTTPSSSRAMHTFFNRDAHNTSQIAHTANQDTRAANQPMHGDEQEHAYQHSYHAYPISGDAYIDTEQALFAARRPLTMIEEARTVQGAGTGELCFGGASLACGQEGEVEGEGEKEPEGEKEGEEEE